jgi:hypothetical protein
MANSELSPRAMCVYVWLCCMVFNGALSIDNITSGGSITDNYNRFCRKWPWPNGGMCGIVLSEVSLNVYIS